MFGSQGGSTQRMMPSTIEFQRSTLDPKSGLSVAGLPETVHKINVARVDEDYENYTAQPS